MSSITPHPNIVKAKEFIASDSWTYLVMELAEGSEMQQFYDENKEMINLSMIKSIIQKLLSAINHLHK